MVFLCGCAPAENITAIKKESYLAGWEAGYQQGTINALPQTDNKSSGTSLTAPIVSANAQYKEFAKDQIISVIELDKINALVGKEAIIEGTVVEEEILSGGTQRNTVTALFFDNPGQHITGYDEWLQEETGRDFRAIIQDSNLSKFDNLLFYYHRKIRLKGIIDRYHGAPVIYLQDKAQLQFADTPPPTPGIETLQIEKNLIYKLDPCKQPKAFLWNIDISITNTNGEWAVHDLYFGDIKIADYIPPSDLYIYQPLYVGNAEPNSAYRIVPSSNSVSFKGTRCIVGDSFTCVWIWIPKL